MLNRTGAGMVSLALALVIAGLPNGNLFISSLALAPVALLAMGTGRRKARIVATLDVPERALRLREHVPIRLDYQVRGRGSALVEQPLPDEFELVAGNNSVLRRTVFGRTSGSLEFTIRCRRRGRFELPPARVEIVPTLHLGGAALASADTARTVEFRAELTRFHRLPGGRMMARRFMPHNDQANVGMKTSDFRDLRDYQSGDPPRSINWNATARRASTQKPGTPILPLVNEYEAEGQRNVWIFLDCGRHMAVGSNVENAFEAAVLGAGSLARFFIDRGFSVGFSLFNHHDPVHLYADRGRRQMVRIETVLHSTETSDDASGLRAAVGRVRGFLHGGSTWAIVVTRAERLDEQGIADLRQLRNATAARRGTTRMMVVSPDPYAMVPMDDVGEAVRALQRSLDAKTIQEVRSLGVRLIHWDPERRPLHAHLVGA